MRIVWLGLVSMFIGAACGKKGQPQSDAQAVTAAADAAATPADTAPADTAAAPADAADPKADAVAAPADAAAAPADAAAAPADAAAAPADAAAAPADAAAAPTDAAAAPADPFADVRSVDTAGMPEPGSPPKPWKDMKEDARKDYMKKSVLPVMRPRLQAYDPEHLAKVTCVTCHGPGAKEGKFKMPNKELTKLPSTREGFAVLLKKKPEGVKFMKEVVVPTMAKLIGEEPFDPATGKEGFGCFECHTKE